MRLSIKTKMILIVLVLILITNFSIGMMSYIVAKNELDKSGEVILKNGVRMILESMHLKQSEVEKNLLTEEEAKEDIKELILGKMDSTGQRPINKSIELGDNGYFFIMDTKGILIAHPTREGEDTWMSTSRGTDYLVTQDTVKKAMNGGGYTYYNWELPRTEEIEEKVIYSEFDDQWGWVIISSIYLSDFNSGADEILKYLLVSLLLTFIVGLVFSYAFARRMSEPIIEISEGINHYFETKELPKLKAVKPRDEIDILHNSFVKLSDELNLEMLMRVKAQKNLEETNESLENTVRVRTLEIKEKNIELQELLKIHEDTEDELRVAIDNLTESQEKIIDFEKNAISTKLISGIAHEINTPLGVAITLESYLEETIGRIENEMKEDQLSRKAFLEYLDEVKESQKMMDGSLRNVSDLVEQFKSVAVDLSYEKIASFDLVEYSNHIVKDCLHDLVDDVKVTYNTKTFVIEGYPRLFMTVFKNLISNAIEHGYNNDELQIYIEFIRTSEATIFTIEDNGKGIESVYLEHIYEPFFKGSNDKSGIGLGLNIVHNIIVRKLQGEVSCQSEPNKFTKFIIKVPINKDRPVFEELNM